jgi:hypothetical protein
MEVMSILKRTLILAGWVAVLGLGTATLLAGRGGGGAGGGGGFGGGGAGGGGGFGRGNMVNQFDTYRQEMAVADDNEWNVISNRIVAVTTARAAATGGNNMAGMRGRGRGAVAADPTVAPAASTPLADAMTALQAAYDAKAPAADIKVATARVQSEHKALQAAYIKAQDDLRSLLTTRQEAYLTLQRVLQ